MSIRILSAFLAACGIAAAAVAVLTSGILRAEREQAASGHAAVLTTNAPPAAAAAELEARVEALELALDTERQARQWLEEEIQYLNAELARLGAGGAADAATPPSGPPSADPAASRPRGPAREVARLVDAGFTAGEAEWIVRRESELAMQALRDRYEAERRGEPADAFGGRDRTSDLLRRELGDAAYERYLEAYRRPTRVAIGSVLESSPAQAAGLVAGDEILSYDGRRVFDLSDLTALTREGEPGQAVVVDIRRAGQPMQVVIPRGPLGITGGRRYSR